MDNASCQSIFIIASDQRLLKQIYLFLRESKGNFYMRKVPNLKKSRQL